MGNYEPLRLRVSGAMACFTRPELKTERVSYSVMTPSAARGVLEAVLWKPAIRWRVERIQVLKEIRWVAFRRNEVSRVATVSSKIAEEGGRAPVLFADVERAQRNTVALSEVAYVIEARFEMTERAGPGDNRAKFVEMFRRRVEGGQHFHQPYLGCREFVAEIEPPRTDERPINDTRDLGIMLYDVNFGSDRNRPIFFAAKLVQGVLEVPDDPEATLIPPLGDGQ